jgi:uncharacterized membrane protein
MNFYLLKERFHKVVPVRCQICGVWGYPSSGYKWICDACLAKLYDENKSVSFLPAEDKTPQTSFH